MKSWRVIAMLLVLGIAPAFAEEAAPEPAPLPIFHAPVASDEDGASQDNAPSIEPDASATTEIATEPSAPAVAPAEPAPPADPQPVTLTAQIAEGGQAINEGLVWRVFNGKPGASGKLTLAAKSEDAVAALSLSPGTYVVEVAYGRAQASDTLVVKPGKNNKSLVLDAGGLRLNAAITGEVPIPINLVHFDIFTPGQTDADRALVAQGLGANDIVTLNAGTYHVVSYFGDVNAVVRADLKVEAGQLTDATLYHRASQISFKLVSEAGGEAIADVDWIVKTVDGATVFTNTGAFPSTVLEEGDYLVLARRGDKVFNRNFAVQPGQPKEIEVLTAVY